MSRFQELEVRLMRNLIFSKCSWGFNIKKSLLRISVKVISIEDCWVAFLSLLLLHHCLFCCAT